MKELKELKENIENLLNVCSEDMKLTDENINKLDKALNKINVIELKIFN